jgi:multidrug efflux pump subunit AcrA (membrane-fusion protein)
MYATAALFGAPSEARPAVPSEAVIRTGEEAAVILALGDGRFRPQPVTLGAEGDGVVQVLDGLSGDERVVTSAQFLIDSEARLAAAVSAMASGDMDAADPTPMGEVDHSHMNH